jgi:hypothetical protein
MIVTKTLVPRRQKGIIRRPRLNEMLLTAPGQSLVLLRAPAGFGKTTLLVDLAHESAVPVSWLFVLLPLAHLLLVPFLWRNWSFWGCRLVAVGLILNLVAMVSNGGLMPVNAAAVLAVGRNQPSELTHGMAIPGTKNYFAGDEGVRFKFLADDIIVALPVVGTKAVSAGDLFALAGGLILYVEGTTRAGLWRYLVAGKSVANGVAQ